MTDAGTTVALALISHTNAGKTTLARTLLARDVGEVRDAPHVTLESTQFPLVTTPAGDALLLWDTPGFGDSARLARRLALESNPVLWFLAQMWDRFRDRPFWLTQQALRTVRDGADVILYLVNAAETPEDAGYLAPELAVLGFMGKPILVLLNQTGPPRPPGDEAADVGRWRTALAPYPHVRGVLAIDAFARCWVQEFALFAAIAPLLAEPQQPGFARLSAAWRAMRWAQFDAAIAALAQPVAAAICARVVAPPRTIMGKVRGVFGIGKDAGDEDRRALEALAKPLYADVHAAMVRVVALHGLEGGAGTEVEARVTADVSHEGPIGEGQAAAVAGVMSGAAAGLAADLVAGGLTLGVGALIGALVGALGGAGVARAINVVRGQSDDAYRWDDAFLLRLVVSQLLRYLAVAHYGRGRGDYRDGEYPGYWRPVVEAAVTAQGAELAAVFAQRGPACRQEAAQLALQPLLAQAARTTLRELYPDAFAAGT